MKEDNKKYSATSIVSVSRVERSIYKAVEKVIRLIGGLQIKKSTKILIKPNLVFPVEASTGIVTNPKVVEGMIQYLMKVRATPHNILVGEASAISVKGTDTRKGFEKSGLSEICGKYGIKFEDLFQGGFVIKKLKLKAKKYVFQISEQIFKNDLIINVPVIKTHLQTGMTIALKNMKGVVNIETRKEMHKMGLHESIAALNRALPKYVTIADGTIGLEGMGPGTTGVPAYLGLIFASRDPVALERVICDIVGIEVPRHTWLAAEFGVGQIENEKIIVLGEEIEALKRKFQPATGRIELHPNIDIIDKLSCTGCMNSMWAVVSKLRGVKGNNITLILGPDINNDNIDIQTKNLIAIGNCACDKLYDIRGIKLLDSLRGCPPSIEDQKGIIERHLRKP